MLTAPKKKKRENRDRSPGVTELVGPLRDVRSITSFTSYVMHNLFYMKGEKRRGKKKKSTSKRVAEIDSRGNTSQGILYQMF